MTSAKLDTMREKWEQNASKTLKGEQIIDNKSIAKILYNEREKKKSAVDGKILKTCL
jgi:hypothetical protein